MCIYFKPIGTGAHRASLPMYVSVVSLGSYRIKKRKEKKKNYLAIRIQSKIPINLML